jgi:hypothetical protein
MHFAEALQLAHRSCDTCAALANVELHNLISGNSAGVLDLGAYRQLCLAVVHVCGLQ